MLWVVIALLAIAIGLLLLALSRQSASKSVQEAMLPTLFTLRTGDIVQYLDEDWIVRGQLTYTEDDFTWLEYMLQDGDRICWLAVEEDDFVTTALLAPTRDLDVTLPPPKQLSFEGNVYQQVERGTARMTRIGTTGIRRAETCRYYDYEGPDKRLLSIEDWDGDIEVTAGQSVRPDILRLLPGGGLD
ncbi:DUF4178 domain-containing protein [Synechococcus sp. PCC 7336]|uniref:DUF4178 domain-containing protein n=1 Tax=Synechococcus sp. PCC 7336 TaxID=195250 RepID=UPI000347F11A|nr:DUF4178 domain-containing protein [Synechococcus sp. PCC 7336]